jgi:hypothetical protein
MSTRREFLKRSTFSGLVAWRPRWFLALWGRSPVPWSAAHPASTGVLGGVVGRTRITMLHLTTGSSTNNVSSYSTATIAPTAKALVLAWVTSTGSSPAVPTVTGCSLTWVQVASFGGSGQRLTLFRAMGAAPTSGSVSISFGAAQTGCAWSIVQFSGVDTSGSDGAGAVVQSAANNATGITSLTVTLGAFADPNNATAGGFASNINAAASAGSGFSYISGAGYATPTAHIDTEWRGDNDTTVDMSFPSSANAAGIAAEIRAAPVPQVTVVSQAVIRAGTW